MTNEYMRVHQWGIAQLRFLLCFGIVMGGSVVTACMIVWGIDANTWIAQRVLLLYNAPLCAVGTWWLYMRVRDIHLRNAAGSMLDVSVFVAALLRAVPQVSLPFSGHMLFLVYSLFVTRNTAYRWVAVVLVVKTTVFKLLLWNDYLTWSIGLGCACIAAVCHRLATAYTKD